MDRYAVSLDVRKFQAVEWREALAGSKFRRIELFCGDFLAPVEIEQLVKLVSSENRSNGIEVAAIHLPFSPFERFPYMAGEKERNAITQYLENFIRITAPIGVPDYTYHISLELFPPEERGRVLDATRPVVERLAAAAAGLGSRLDVELPPHSTAENCVYELDNLMKGISREKIGISFDVNHLYGTPERVPEFIGRLGERIRTLHISDNDGVDEAHWLPGLGVLNWPEIMKEIRRLPDSPLLIFETVPLRPHVGLPREIPPELHFRHVERAAFYLENCEELDARIAEADIP